MAKGHCLNSHIVEVLPWPIKEYWLQSCLKLITSRYCYITCLKGPHYKRFTAYVNCTLQARFLLSKVNPSQTHSNMYAYGGVSVMIWKLLCCYNIVCFNVDSIHLKTLSALTCVKEYLVFEAANIFVLMLYNTCSLVGGNQCWHLQGCVLT
jgi:hypothetical protein